MSAPRLEIDLDKLQHNARTLVDRLAGLGISVTGVMKSTLGSPEVACALLRAGVSGLADSRIENIETLRRGHVTASMTLIRSPMLSQAERVVAHADVSFNTELDVLRKLSSVAAATGKTHGVVLMVELGDLREGILPGDLAETVRATLRLPNLALKGIGANLACRSGVAPSSENMGELSELVDSIEAAFGLELGTVSGGNSANLTWALSGESTGRINDLRLGEAIVLGRQPLTRSPIEGLYTDAITLHAEVIEAKRKPSVPWGELAQAAFGEPPPVTDRGHVWQTILALGRQDVDVEGLHAPAGIEVLASSSDHLVLDPGSQRLAIGAEVTFQLDYGALVRAMTSPFVTQVLRDPSGRASLAGHDGEPTAGRGKGPAGGPTASPLAG